MSSTTLQHIQHFTGTIGPRGSATAGEKKAHEYCQAVYEGLGYEPHWEEFYSPVSGWHPFGLALGLMVLASVLFFVTGLGPNAAASALAAAVLGASAVVSFFLQISHRDNPLRWFLPTAKSQNVWVVAKPKGEVKRRIVVSGHVDTTPFVKGGNDNATGAAAVLTLAGRLKREPLANTEVFLVNTGCEEVACYGMVDWITRHAWADAPSADYLVLDNIGGKNSEVNYVLDETVLLPFKSDSKLVRLAEAVAKEQPDLGATPFHYRGLFSEISLSVRHGQRALGLLNFDPKTKMPPNFHTARDDFNNVDPEVLGKSERFAWAIMQKIDGQG